MCERKYARTLRMKAFSIFFVVFVDDVGVIFVVVVVIDVVIVIDLIERGFVTYCLYLYHSVLWLSSRPFDVFPSAQLRSVPRCIVLFRAAPFCSAPFRFAFPMIISS